jgi:hypothetical protein
VDDKSGSAQQNQYSGKKKISLLAHIKAVNARSPERATDYKFKKAKKPMSRFERATIGLAILGTLLGVITAVIFYRQFREMARQTGILNHQAQQAATDSIESTKKVERQLVIAQQQVKAAADFATALRDQLGLIRSNFAKEERPYMWPKADPIIFEKGQQLIWNVHLFNYGKSPAMRTRSCYILFTGDNAMPQATAFSTPDIIKECVKGAASGPIESESIAPPGDALFLTAHSIDLLTDDSIAFYRDSDFHVAMLVFLTYQDVAGNTYRSLFCTSHLRTGAMYSCGKNNDIH